MRKIAIWRKTVNYYIYEQPRRIGLVKKTKKLLLSASRCAWLPQNICRTVIICYPSSNEEKIRRTVYILFGNLIDFVSVTFIRKSYQITLCTPYDCSCEMQKSCSRFSAWR